MGLMAHVKVFEIADKTILDAPASPVDKYEPKGKAVSSPAAVAYAVPDNGSIHMATLRYRLKGLRVRIAEQAFQTVPAGSLILDPPTFAKLKPEVEELGLTF